MKNYTIMLFMLGVLAGLAAICIIFPDNGIKIGEVTLEFPHLKQVLEVKEDNSPKLSPEELLRQRKMARQRETKNGQFLESMKNDPARFYFPKNNPEYFDEFFNALEKAKKKHIRIMHYADSQLEEDFMTCTLRKHFQEKFGGGGVGMLTPVETVEMVTMTRSMSPEMHNFLVYGAKEGRGNGNKYGPMGSATHLNGNVHYSFNGCNSKKFPTSSQWNKVSVVMAGSGTMTVTAEGQSKTLSLEKQSGNMKIFSALIPKSKICSLNISGNMDLYSIMLDDDNGVSVDNIPMRGCSGTIFTNIKGESFAPFFKMQDVPLIILQYGGNNITATMTEKQVEHYAELLKEQIELFHSMAPKAKILFIGPADMSTSIRGEKVTYPIMPRFNEILKKMVNDSGAAYWNMYEAMGGNGSMVQWVKDGLAAKDYVHFNMKGAEKMTEVLYDSFNFYYDYYKLRKYGK